MEEFLDIFINNNNQFDNIALDFVKTFNSVSGKKVLRYLIFLTMLRYLPASASSDELRFLEGERYLVSFILNMIKKGKKG